MIPLPPANHLDLAREMTSRPRSPRSDDFDVVSGRRYELVPDPVYLTMNRLWTRITDRLVGGFRKTV